MLYYEQAFARWSCTNGTNQQRFELKLEAEYIRIMLNGSLSQCKNTSEFPTQKGQNKRIGVPRALRATVWAHVLDKTLPSFLSYSKRSLEFRYGVHDICLALRRVLPVVWTLL